MRRVWVSPAKYVQGSGELERLGFFVKIYGKSALLIGTKEDIERVRPQLRTTAEKYEIEFIESRFSGECTKKEVDRLKEMVFVKNCQCIVGLGGGKALDMAKGVANGQNLILVPTIAATDAPTSSATVFYNEDGTLENYTYFSQSPSVVLLDSDVIVKAPVRFLVAGMGDALSTYYEAFETSISFGSIQAAKICGEDSELKTCSTLAAKSIAKTCLEVVLKDGIAAKEACIENKVTEAFENILEANTLLSGLGFENGGLAAAHAIHDGMTLIDSTRPYLHGEKIAFCLLVQFVLENRSIEEIKVIFFFMKKVGLPTNFAAVGLDKATEAELFKAARAICLKNDPLANMSMKISPAELVSAWIEADDLETLLTLE